MKLSLGGLPPSGEDAKLLSFFQKNFSLMSETVPEDIFIAGYPKSGNTWFQNLVAGLVFGIVADKTCPDLINDLVPDVHHNPAYKRYQTPTFFKTHYKPLPEYKNVVYLLRDGRDVMVSYWHHQCAMERREISFLDMVRNGTALFPCKWHEHVTAWMANPYQARMLVIKYEDLLIRPVRELERFCDFTGREIDHAYLELIAEKASFKYLQSREQRTASPNSLWPKEKAFFRRGKAGSFHDEMPDDVLKVFMTEAKEILEKQGYF